MGRMNSKLLALGMVISLLVTACASRGKGERPGSYSEPPVRTDRLIVSSAKFPLGQANSIYRKAENLYARRHYSEAVQTYKRFITESSPQSDLIDNAYFKIGMSWFEMGRYRDALYFFDVIIDRFRNSEVYEESLINSGICRYHLNEFEKAENTFNIVLTRNVRPGNKAYIYFFLGSLSEKKSDFTEAIKFYVEAEKLAQSTELVVISKSKIGRILHNFLGEGELVSVTKKYSSRWPAKLAFEELIRIYRQNGDAAALARTKKTYESQFALSTPPKGHVGQTIGDDTFTPSRIKIGAVLPLSGPNAKTGREIVQGMQLAFNSFQKLVRDRGIHLVIKDSGSDPGGASDVVERIAQDRDTILVIGPVFSSEFENSAAVAERYRIPVFSPSATAEGAASLSDYLYRNTLTNSVEAAKIAELAVDTLGLRKFVVIHPEDKYGWEVGKFFTDSVERRGAEVLAVQTYSPDQTDFGKQIVAIGGMTDSELRKIIMKVARENPGAGPETLNSILMNRYSDKISTPQIINYGKLPLTRKNFLPGLQVKYDAIFIPGLYDKVGLIMPELEFYNIKGITRLSGKGVNHPDFIKIGEQYSRDVIFLDGFFKDSDSPAVQSFVRDYNLYFHSDPTILAAQAYDAVRIALSAIAHGAGSRREMKKYLQMLRFFEGLTGETSMNPDGDAVKSVTFLTVDNGKIVRYIPPDQRVPK